jgi:DNA-binding XRE family transcriptional regulator
MAITGKRNRSKNPNAIALKSIARRAPRIWRTEHDLRNAGFEPVRGGLPEVMAASRLRRLARQLVAARKRAGLTRAEVARRMGTTAAAVSQMEREHPGNVTIDALNRFARAVGAELRVALVSDK